MKSKYPPSFVYFVLKRSTTPSMKSVKTLFFLVGFFITYLSANAQSVFELRIYHCEPGRLPALLQRFENHTLALFEKHGMKNVGYWTALADSNALYYVLEYPSLDARQASWKAFGEDPVWQAARSASEASGKIVQRVESIFLNMDTRLSPKIQKVRGSAKNRVHELRIYYAKPGKMPELLDRFANHTRALFDRHQLKNVMYFTTVNEPTVLYYWLAHPQGEAKAKDNWKAFVQDPDWKKAATESEKNGPLVDKIISVYMKATDFSKIK